MKNKVFSGYRVFRNKSEIGFFSEYSKAKSYAIKWKNKFPDSVIEIRFHGHRYEIEKGYRKKWRITQIY